MEKGRNRAGKKTVIAAVLAGLIVIGCATASLVTGDGLFEYQVRQTIGKKVVFITKYLGTDTEIVFPDQIDGFEVWTISSSSFSTKMEDSSGKFVGLLEGKSLTSIVLPKNLLSIEMRTFAKNNLTNVTLPNNVSLGQSVFAENPITSFTLGTDIKCYSKSLNTLTPYYYGNDRQAGEYKLDNGIWEFNGSVPNLPAVIKTIGTAEISLTMVGLDGKIFSTMTPNPYRISGEYWISAGNHVLTIAKDEKKAGGGVSIAGSGPRTELRGNFQAGTIYEIREKADKTGIEYVEMGAWTPPK